jgi:hypothetical protein
VIFTEPARTEVPTTVGTIFTDKALALDISDHPTDQDGVTAEGITAEGIMAGGIMAEGIMAEGVMAEGVMGVVGTSKRGHYLCRVFHNK